MSLTTDVNADVEVVSILDLLSCWSVPDVSLDTEETEHIFKTPGT